MGGRDFPRILDSTDLLYTVDSDLMKPTRYGTLEWRIVMATFLTPEINQTIARCVVFWKWRENGHNQNKYNPTGL